MPDTFDRDRFVQNARDQVGDPYRYGAHAARDDANPTAWDSSELVEWAAERAGVADMPDGSWQQYRWLQGQQAAVPVDEALRTRGALVFGFSSDPLVGDVKPDRAYVGISLGDGRVLDVSERAGEVREMDPGGFYTHGAVIPDQAGDDVLGIPGAGTMPPPVPAPAPEADPVTPPEGEISRGPNGRIIHQDIPMESHAPEPEEPVCYPDEPLPEEPVCYPDPDDTYGDI